MSKIVLNAVADLTSTTTAQTTINNNSNTIQTAFDNTLSRDGTSPNQMSAPLDMNSNRIINLPTPTSNFDAVRLLDVTSLGTGGSITVNPLPPGGTTGQVLEKNSNTNFDAGWSSVVTGVNVTSGKTLSATNSLILTGTDGTTQTFPTTSDTIAGLNSTQTLANKTINTASGNTVAINGVPLTTTTGSGSSVVLANVPSIASPTITGAFTATNLVGNTSLAQMPAVTLKGNPTSGTANASDFTINSLTTLGAPDAVNDYTVMWDHTAGTLKKVNPTAISGAVVAGVASIAGNTGVFTLGSGLTNSSNIILADASYHRGYIAGNTLSGGGSQTLTISAGVACSDDASTLMKLPSTFTKAIGTAWGVGTAAGSLDTGAVANSTWYHVYIIERLDTGLVDVLTSVSATAPTLPTNYTVKRRIGSFVTDGSANITAFTQVGEDFFWGTPVQSVNVSNLGTGATLFTIAVPLGVITKARIRGEAWGSVSGTSVLITSPSEPSSAASNVTGLVTSQASQSGSSPGGIFTVDVLTNTAQQIRAVASQASSSLIISVYGWIDTRGKFA